MDIWCILRSVAWCRRARVMVHSAEQAWCGDSRRGERLQIEWTILVWGLWCELESATDDMCHCVAVFESVWRRDTVWTALRGAAWYGTARVARGIVRNSQLRDGNARQGGVSSECEMCYRYSLMNFPRIMVHCSFTCYYHPYRLGVSCLLFMKRVPIDLTRLDQKSSTIRWCLSDFVGVPGGKPAKSNGS